MCTCVCNQRATGRSTAQARSCAHRYRSMRRPRRKGWPIRRYAGAALSLGTCIADCEGRQQAQRLRALQGLSAYLNNVRMELAALETACDKEKRKNAANEVATRKRMAALQGELDNARQAKYAPCSLIKIMYAHR